MKKRILSLFLALVMLFSCLSLNVFATEGEEAQTEIAAGTVVSNTLDAHTDEEIKALINATKKQSISYYNTATNSINPAHGYTTGKNPFVFENGVVVRTGLATDKGYLQQDTVLVGRSVIKNISSYKNLVGQKFVIQFDVKFTDEFFKVFGNTQGKNLIQIGDYTGNVGYESSIYRPGAVMTSILNVTNGSLTLKDTTKTLFALEADTNYSIAVHVDPSEIDAANGVYGTIDLYVNGNLIAENTPFLTEKENNDLTMPEDRPYFIDNSSNVTDVWDGTTLVNPANQTAYFFSNEFDVTVDADINGVWDVYQNVPGITAESGYPTAKFIGTSKGVQDFALGLARFFQNINSNSITDTVYYADNFMVYYADEYVGTLVDHVIKNNHAHDFSKETTTVTYTCELCDGKKVVNEVIDANGDRVCDICANLPTGGVLSVEDIYKENVNVKAAENFNNGSKGVFTFGDDGDAVFKFSTDEGNKYIYSVPGTTAKIENGKVVTDENGDTVMRATSSYLQYQNLGSTRIDTVKKFSSLAGQSYVLTTDIKVSPDNIASSSNLFQVLCYLQSKDNCTAIGGAVFFKPILLNDSGELKYRDDGKEIGTNIFINDGEWHTISVYHTPRGANPNTYDLYVDGKLIRENITALTTQDNTDMTWSTTQLDSSYGTTTFACNGVTDFIPAITRFAQHTPALKKGATDNYSIALDNTKIYYTDTFVECAHDYVMSHTHDIENNNNEVTYVCKNCHIEKVIDIAMTTIDYSSFNGTGSILSVDDTNAIVGVNKIQTYADGVTFGNDNDNVYQTVTENGNTYMKVGIPNGKTAPYKIAIGDNFGQFNNLSYPFQVSTANKYSSLAGKSYVASVDFKFYSNECYLTSNGNVRTDFPIIAYMCYMKGTDGCNAISNFSETAVLSTDNKGNILYRDGKTGDYVELGVNIDDGVFHTIAYHHTPKGDATSPKNTYDIYVDGLLKKENVQFLTKQESDSMDFTSGTLNAVNNNAYNPTQVTYNGAEDFIPALFRTAHFGTAYTIKDDVIGIDNVKIYYSDTYLDCAHTYSDSNVCDWCGHTVEVKKGHCDICDGTAISDEVAITGRSVALGELVDMNFYAAVNGALANDENAVATVSCGNKSETIALKSAKIDGGYKFSLPLRSTQMASDVTIEIDGATYTTSIVDYALDLIELDAKAAPVAKALLNYGAAAQIYFAEKNNDAALDDVLANAGLDAADKAVSELTAEELGAYAFAQSGATEAVHFTGAKLQMASKTHMLLYFTAPEGATVTVNGVKAYAVKDGDEYYISLTAETPVDAMTGKTEIAVTYGTITATTTVNVFTAVAEGVKENSNANLTAMLTAYAQYCKAAEAYVAN